MFCALVAVSCAEHAMLHSVCTFGFVSCVCGGVLSVLCVCAFLCHVQCVVCLFLVFRVVLCIVCCFV